MLLIPSWVIIIAYILMKIAEGYSRGQAVDAAASTFGLSACSIWKHGGF